MPVMLGYQIEILLRAWMYIQSHPPTAWWKWCDIPSKKCHLQLDMTYPIRGFPGFNSLKTWRCCIYTNWISTKENIARQGRYFTYWQVRIKLKKYYNWLKNNIKFKGIWGDIRNKKAGRNNRIIEYSYIMLWKRYLMILSHEGVTMDRVLDWRFDLLTTYRL
jgi:hypothetical protein